VPWAAGSARVAFTGFERLREKASVVSIAVSPTTGTTICCTVSPGSNVSVPVVVW
jgi:hypothetical protein